MGCAANTITLFLNHRGRWPEVIKEKCDCMAAHPTWRDTTNLCHGMVLMNLSHTLALVSYPDPLPAAILFSARIKWRPEVGLGIRLHWPVILCNGERSREMKLIDCQEL